MNRVVVFCSSVFLLGIFTCVGAGEHFPFLGEASKGPVYVRAGANINFEALDKIPKGGRIMVMGRYYEWYKVQLPATTGVYIRADYVKETGNGGGEVIGDKVNVRARANSDSSSLGQLKKGDMVKLAAKVRLPDGQANDWWKIEPPAAAEGWVHADLIVPAAVPSSAEMLSHSATADKPAAAP